jgi:hypothetical protein
MYMYLHWQSREEGILGATWHGASRSQQTARQRGVHIYVCVRVGLRLSHSALPRPAKKVAVSAQRTGSRSRHESVVDRDAEPSDGCGIGLVLAQQK